jgi:hypothetical protein
MDFNVPPGTRMLRDASDATWGDEALPGGSAGIYFPVRGLVPQPFERYARVLHPARSPDDPSRRVRWSELATARGEPVHPRAQFNAIVGGWGPEEVADWDYIVPSEELPKGVAVVLVGLLSGFTTSPDACWFALWDGYGSLGPGHHVSYEIDHLGGREIVEDTRAEAEEFWTMLETIPRLRTSLNGPFWFPPRDYFLFHGPLRALTGFCFRGGWQPPNIWWPEDHAWSVGTDVDGYDTFIGGSAECVDAVLHHLTSRR